ncbi:probable E3 ubiquitin-protein ligase ARI8 [Papaver somniferum]|uniref:probable E3 ubiquitin-protein ligase ARI8 n=1 Tax=Papaver somniferum TaxID=3469 RepID=UPI000E6FB6A5|nr:probable E3 ubiquitin-protein ligase ARI8 [Papaver somniferum]
MYSDDDIYDDDDFTYEDEDDLPPEAPKEAPEKNCAVMHADVIRQKQEADISSVSNVLDVSRASAIIALLHYKWCVSNTSVSDGPGCLKLRCPDPSCNAAVGQDMINTFACKENKQKYANYLLRSYIEDNKEFKWCPAPDCGLAIKFDVGNDNCDVICECIYSFCWNCSKEAHRPVDCSTMEKWILKNNDESENVTWILAHSKPCPNCKRPIEKSVGCNHMRCSICQFRFCWVCLVSLDNHSCNGYKVDAANDNLERNTARNHLAKYTHYYLRWAANHKSLDHAVKYTKNMQTCARVEELCFILCLADEKELKLIKDAWEKIIECRRVLKWSYAFGYYLPEHEHGKIQLFEYLQGQAESGLESLHQYAEEELETCLVSETPLGNFKIFQKELEKQTTATANFFESLANAFKNGMSEVDSQGAGSSNRERATDEYDGRRDYGRNYASTTSLHNEFSRSDYFSDDYYYG